MTAKHSVRPDGSELRQHPVTGKWSVIAAGRAKRPQEIASMAAKRPLPPAYVERCPFCNLREFPQAPETLVLPAPGPKWKVRVFPNKFPAFQPKRRVRTWRVGPYAVMDGVGFHEVITPRAHNAYPFRLSAQELTWYYRAWRDRYTAFMTTPSVAYIQLIENYGPASGGSVEHAHAQLFAIPVLPSDEVLDLLAGAERYFATHARCAYCELLTFERQQKQRLIYENARFTVLSPFAPRVPYEQWVLPRRHAAGFDELRDADLPAFADAMRHALTGLAKGFRNPAYNVYVYSAPCDTEEVVIPKSTYTRFHWHAQILPRLNIWGGFELATGMEIVAAVPEDVAAYLREQQ